MKVSRAPGLQLAVSFLLTSYLWRKKALVHLTPWPLNELPFPQQPPVLNVNVRTGDFANASPSKHSVALTQPL